MCKNFFFQKRALKLEQQKQKEALEKVQQREHEERLIAKPSASSSSSSISWFQIALRLQIIFASNYKKSMWLIN